MNIINENKAKVKNKANVFSPAGNDRATQECDLRVSAGPPIGESTLAIFVSDNTSMGGTYPINSSDRLCEAPPLFDLDYYKGMCCSLDSHYFDVPIRLDNSKQVGILKSEPIRDQDQKWLDRFNELKQERDHLADILFKAGRYKEAGDVRNCGESFLAYKALCCGDTLARPMSCGHRLCPVCMVRRSAKLSTKVEKLIRKMGKPKHIVLTVENVPRINKEYFKWLRKCFVKLRHRDIFSKCVGGFYSIETTYNSEKKNWHVHIHIVADVSYIPKQGLVDNWNDITGGSFIVDIHEIKDSVSASKEIAKYVVKPGSFLEDHNLVNEYLRAVKGSRLVSTFGKYYGLVLDDDEEEEGELPDCWCGKNEWYRLTGVYSIDDVFKDVQGFYRLKEIISDG